MPSGSRHLQRLRFALCICLLSLCWLGGISIASAAGTPTIRDEAKLFPEETAAKMQSAMQQCRQKSGVAIHIVTFASLYDDWENRSQRLLDELTGDDPAILLVFGWGMQVPVVKISPALGERYPIIEQSELLNHAKQPFSGPDVEATLSQKFATATARLSEGYQRLDRERLARESMHFPKELFLSLAAILMGAALLMWLLILWLGRSSARYEEHYFPQVEVGQRLGASFGGGVIVQTGTSRRSDPQ